MDVTDDIMGVAQQYLSNIRRSGSENIMAICPFHRRSDGSEEQHPSFAMSLTNGLYFCHSCEERGNLYTFLKHMGVPRTLVNERFGLVLDAAKKRLPPKPNPLDPKVISLNPLPEGLLGAFDYCPNALLDAGFTESTLRAFDVGFDMQHYRITFPLRDLKGQLIGISGRTVIDAWPRYKVYTEEYPVWGLPARPELEKRAILWNSHAVYPSCYFGQLSYVVIVEGFKACMWLWQAGIMNVVALLGTYLSWEHRWMLERMGAQVYLFLDNNEPGRIGTYEAGKKLCKSLPVRVMRYPTRLRGVEEAQPDSLSIEELREASTTSIDYYNWLRTDEGELIHGIRKRPHTAGWSGPVRG